MLLENVWGALIKLLTCLLNEPLLPPLRDIGFGVYSPTTPADAGVKGLQVFFPTLTASQLDKCCAVLWKAVGERGAKLTCYRALQWDNCISQRPINTGYDAPLRQAVSGPSSAGRLPAGIGC